MKKTKIILLLCITAIFAVALALLAGCEVGGIEYEYDYLVTFDYNVSHLGVATNCETQYLGVNDGDLLIAPGSHDKFKTYEIDNFYNKGWFTAKTDESGNPVKDAGGKIVLDKQWDFENDKVNSNMTLYADYHHNPTLTIKVDGGNDIVVTRSPGTRFSRPVSINVPEKDGYTFIDYYEDPEFTTKFEFPYMFKEDVTTECYALMLEGTWKIVTNATEFRSALQGNQNMYLAPASGEINFVTSSGPIMFRENQCNVNYKGKIYGNGCTLSNITIDQLTYKNGQKTYSLFGNLSKDVEITDVKFKNLTLTMKGLEYVSSSDTELLQSIQVALFANEIADGAKLESIVFEDCTLDYGIVSKSDIITYGYYSSIPQSVNGNIFDLSNLTIKRNNQEVTID